MAPTQSTGIAVQTAQVSAKSVKQSHQVSVPAIVALALFLVMMAALAVGVILRHRRAMTAKRRHTQETPPSTRAPWFPLSCFKAKSTASAGVGPTAVGALHATSVFVAAAPSKMFPSPMTMHFRNPLEDQTVLILGTPCFPAQCVPQLNSVPSNDQTRVQHHHCCNFAPRSPLLPESAAIDDPSWDHRDDLFEIRFPTTSPPSRPSTSEAHGYQTRHQGYHRRSQSHPVPELYAWTPLTHDLTSSKTSRKHRVDNWDDLPVLCVKLPLTVRQNQPG
ncbi:hypothetical protein BS17DRAFT_779853 [Gyrodon lividus]|nr:hypothetical protein BS17DRAFT_779853 [Gyrodon lividus]